MRSWHHRGLSFRYMRVSGVLRLRSFWAECRDIAMRRSCRNVKASKSTVSRLTAIAQYKPSQPREHEAFSASRDWLHILLGGGASSFKTSSLIAICGNTFSSSTFASQHAQQSSRQSTAPWAGLTTPPAAKASCETMSGAWSSKAGRLYFFRKKDKRVQIPT